MSRRGGYENGADLASGFDHDIEKEKFLAGFTALTLEMV